MTAIQHLLTLDKSQVLRLLGAAIGVGTIWQILTAIYNVFFHPLRDFPGPLSQRMSSLPWAYQHIRGKQAFNTQKLHEIYGPVVRISPSHLSFTEAVAWKDIYGHLIGHKSGQPEMSKTRAFASTLDDIPSSIINADRDEHGKLRRALAHGFSDSSLRQQEAVINRHVDKLLAGIHQACASGKPVNAEAWYNWTTFDITGELIFGETFDCLDGNTSSHSWIESLLGTIHFGAYIQALSYIGLHWVVQLLYRSTLGASAMRKSQGNIRTLLDRRVSSNLNDNAATKQNHLDQRDDLFEGLVSRREELQLSDEKLGTNAFILVLAGSETTATTLAGVTYLLLAHPDKLAILQREVRGAFRSREEITMTSVNKLSYMLAVLNEALRMYPPVTSGLVRVVPEGGAMVAGRWVAGGTMVEVQHWSINHSTDNWSDPWEFRPERFLPATATEKGSSDRGHDVLESLQAFSNGPRNCIGRNLAYAEMRLILARIVFDFDLKLAEDSKNWVERQKTFTLWDRKPLNVFFTPVQSR